MKQHLISEAKARFSEVVQDAQLEPQLILHRREPVAALIGIADWNRLRALDEAARQPSMAALLDKLRLINKDEEDLVVPTRETRAAPTFVDTESDS